MTTQKLAFIVKKFADHKTGGEEIIHFNFLNFLINKGIQVDIYCDTKEIINSKNQYNIFDNFSKFKNEYLYKIKNNNYTYIIANRYGLKISELHADMYTIHSHSDLFSQKNIWGYFYSVFKPKQNRIKSEIKNLKANSSAKYIFCSKQLQNDYTSLCELKNTKVIYPYPNYTDKNEEPKKKNKTYTFGLSALGFSNKGGYITLQSALLLKLSGKKFNLKIIYKKEPRFLQKLLLNIFLLKNNVQFLPKQKDMSNFYRSIDCLLVPSRLESFSMVAAEAISFNIPIIVSSNCGIKEVIENEPNCYIFKFNWNKIWNLYKKMRIAMNITQTNQNKYILNNEKNYNSKLYQEIFKNEK